MDRNPHCSLSKEPITKEMLDRLRHRLDPFWEDTRLVSEPNHHYMGIEVGNLQALIDLAQKGLENIQLTAFES